MINFRQMLERRPEKKPSPILETPEQLLEKRLRFRCDDAVNKDRVLPDEFPLLIGTWDLGTPTRGLFEVYPDHPPAEDGKFSGKIEDLLGTATFTGTINKREIIFTIKYCPGISSNKAPKTIIPYIGRFNGVEYEGNYEIQDGNFVLVRKPFRLRLFTESVAKDRPYRLPNEDLSWYLLAGSNTLLP